MEIPPFLRLDLEGVKQWIKKVKTNHAGEEYLSITKKKWR